MDSGVATRPIADLEAYRDRLSQFVFRSGLLMKPMFDKARADPRRLVYAEGEDERVLRAVQAVIDEGLAQAGPHRASWRDRAAARAGWACGSSRRRISSSSTPTAIRALPTTGGSITA